MPSLRRLRLKKEHFSFASLSFDASKERKKRNEAGEENATIFVRITYNILRTFQKG